MTNRISIFDIFKIGVGPSSSHTLGPWKAATSFSDDLQESEFDKIEVHLFGSLSKTGRGHATDVAVQLGLEKHSPKTIDTSKISFYIDRIKNTKTILVNKKNIKFTPSTDIIFHSHAMPRHPNTVTFKAYLKKNLVLESTYYSVGGGFILKEGEDKNKDPSANIVIPYPTNTGEDLLRYINETGFGIPEIVYKNELAFRSKNEIKENIHQIFNTMLECVYKGCHNDGTLPGGLNVKRRAKFLHQKLLPETNFDNLDDWITAIKKSQRDFSTINKWISCFALAVNEENAALGRVVTSPTNGAAGVIPAVLLYFHCFCENKGMKDIEKFMLVAGEIGTFFKRGATISAAVGGCQAEIGVSSAMAAGGLTEVLGGTPDQILMAAEIAMEHHLGMTCDPIGGLVQIPCIERNSMGAMKAITASNLALTGNPKDAFVKFDVVVKTMWDTAQEMNHKYKETAEGGLAFNFPVNIPNC